MTATTFHLGYFVSGVFFTILIAIPAVAHRWFGLNAIFAFWFAYIVTRPLGASYADWLGVSHARGGLNWGSGSVSVGPDGADRHRGRAARQRNHRRCTGRRAVEASRSETREDAPQRVQVDPFGLDGGRRVRWVQPAVGEPDQG